MFKDATRRVRDYIDGHGEEFLEIIEKEAFKSILKSEDQH